MIGNGVRTLRYSVFNACTSLISVTLGKNVTEIQGSIIPDLLVNGGAFENCISLTDIFIPANVQVIGDHAFNNCRSLTVHCEAEAKPDGWHETWNASLPVIWGESRP